MRIPAEKFELINREHVIRALELLTSGRQTKFAESTKYDVLYNGRRFAPKEVAGSALELASGREYGPHDFSGGESSACFRALRGLGFTIVPKIDPVHVSLTSSLSEIASLQPRYSSANTPEMKRRGTLIREVVPAALFSRLEEIEPIFTQSGYECCIEGSDGKGLKNESPWVRIYDPIESPRATVGWYVVIHFARDGKLIFFTLGCGATYFKDGSLIPTDKAILEKRTDWARSALPRKDILKAGYQESIRLGGSSLSEQFERATAFAKRYAVDDLSEEILWEDLKNLSFWLIRLYDLERQGKTPLSENIDVSAAQARDDLTSHPGKRAAKSGQGRGLSYPERVAVEKRAMELAHHELERRGFLGIKDKSANESYDFEAELNGERWFVEVKGTTNLQGSSIMLTANELRLHQTHIGKTILCVVSDISLSQNIEGPLATGGFVEFHWPWNLCLWEFSPLSFKATLRQEKLS